MAVETCLNLYFYFTHYCVISDLFVSIFTYLLLSADAGFASLDFLVI